MSCILTGADKAPMFRFGFGELKIWLKTRLTPSEHLQQWLLLGKKKKSSRRLLMLLKPYLMISLNYPRLLENI